tara:strand:+ start:384 stop:755 length:372 start_codon:yes stop_codon:yes gene_type:complete
MSTIKANTLLHSDGSTTTQPSIPALDQRMAKAWCVYDGIANSITASYNVSSLTDNATGEHSVNLTTALSTDTPCFNCSSRGNATASMSASYTSTATSFYVRVIQPDTLAKVDVNFVSVTLFTS